MLAGRRKIAAGSDPFYSTKYDDGLREGTCYRIWRGRQDASSLGRSGVMRREANMLLPRSENGLHRTATRRERRDLVEILSASSVRQTVTVITHLTDSKSEF